MKKAIGLDYGQKRVGVSISDSSQIIATGLTTVINQNIFHFLNNLFLEEEIDTIVVGYSKNLDGTDSDISTEIENFICKLNSNSVVYFYLQDSINNKIYEIISYI